MIKFPGTAKMNAAWAALNLSEIPYGGEKPRGGFKISDGEFDGARGADAGLGHVVLGKVDETAMNAPIY
jgi:hypothetical protein